MTPKLPTAQGEGASGGSQGEAPQPRPALAGYRCSTCGQDTHGGWLLKAGAPIPCCEDCRALALTA